MSELSRAASCLADLAHALGSGQEASQRVRRALATLRRLVPHDRCALANSVAQSVPRHFVEPALPDDERRQMAAKAEALLELVADRRGGEPIPVAGSVSAAHLALPLVSLGEPAGVLLVERDAGAFGEQDLQLLSVVASQLGAYLATLRSHEEERRATEALRETMARRTHFLGLLSHELRNPLTPIGNALHVLERVGAESEQAHRARAVIARQFRHLSRLVNDLLDLTRVTSGKIRLERTRLDLADVVQRTVEDHRSLFAEAGVELRVHASRAPVWVDGDPVRLAQVVGNLLVNAAKFSPAGARADVSVRRGGASAIVRVRDRGAGIPPDALDRIFEPFVQGDGTLHRNRDGLGLGLALAKDLVELHGGAIEARSAGVGRGARFIVRLPLAAEPRDGIPAATPVPATARTRRVLVVEDNRDAAETLREILQLSGHAVQVAHDGREALERAVAFDPEVVLCNIGLPGMMGYDVARALRSTTGGGRRRIVALTGHGLDEDRRRVAEAGFDAHLVKPVAPEQLEEALFANAPAAPRPAAGPAEPPA